MPEAKKKEDYWPFLLSIYVRRNIGNLIGDEKCLLVCIEAFLCFFFKGEKEKENEA